MASRLQIDPGVFQVLRDYAEQQGCTVEHLIESWLVDAATPSAKPPSLYRDLLDRTSDTVALLDLDLRYLYVNPMLGRLMGRDPAEMIGRTDAETGMAPEMAARFRRDWDEVIAFEFETPLGPQYFESRLTPIIGDDGAVQYLLAITRDITRYYLAERALKESEEKYRLIAENTSDGIAIYDAAQGYVIYASPAYDRQHGRQPGETVGRNASTILEGLHPDDLDDVLAQLGAAIQAKANEVTYTYRIQHQAGHYFWREDHTRFIYDEDANWTQAYIISRDVSARIQAEEARQRSESYMREVLESVSDIVWAVDLPDCNMIYVSDAVEAISGRPVQDFYANNQLWYDIIHPDDLGAVQAAESNLIANGQAEWEYRIVRTDGEARWMHDRATIVFDQNDVPVRVAGIATDITERKRHQAFALENERLKARFKQEQEHNQLIQQMISALSHDLRTPLTVIATSKDILSQYHGQISEKSREEKLERIGRQVQYMLELLNDTVHMVRGNLEEKTFHPASVNLATLCQVSVEEISAAADAIDHRLVFDNPGAVSTAIIDEVLVSRILLNLLSNAIKYSPLNSEIRLELDRQPGAILLRVIDQGIGIDPDDLPHIFNPFYRADSVRQLSGTGLGLSIVRDCVQRHNGQITIDSTPGQGTTFTLSLPDLPGAATG
ncbi:MAG: PAS domain S-box protein [Chloroflexota bacterium]